MSNPITKVNYLFRKNNANEQLLQAGYYEEQISHFGIPVTYFRYNLDYFAESPSSTIANLTYGESPTSQYTLSAPMVVYMKVDQDSPLLKRFGIETSTQSEIYFSTINFTETWKDIIGTPTTAVLTSYIEGDIINFSGSLSGDIYNDELDGYTSANTIVPSGDISGNQSFSFIRYPLAINDLLVNPYCFTSRIVNGSLSGNVAGTIDISGNGYLSGIVSGVLDYFQGPSINHGPHFQIAPQVGDFIRLGEFDQDVDNYEEYEITRILERSLTQQGLNPLLKRYIWGCQVVRRDPSKETIVGDLQQEKFTPDLLEETSWHEVVSNKIFNYDTTAADSVDKAGANSAYGGY